MWWSKGGVLFRLISLILSLLLITGCGFHLRGLNTPQPRVFSIHLAPERPYDKIFQQIRAQLQAQGIHFLSTADQNPAPTLWIVEQHFDPPKTLAYGAQGQIRRERLVYTFIFRLEGPEHQLIIPQTTLFTERERLLNPGQDLADAHEKDLLEQEMIAEVTEQLSSYLHF